VLLKAALSSSQSTNNHSHSRVMLFVAVCGIRSFLYSNKLVNLQRCMCNKMTRFLPECLFKVFRKRQFFFSPNVVLRNLVRGFA